MGFKDDIVAISRAKQQHHDIINNLKASIKQAAESGSWCYPEIYKLETENKYYLNVRDTVVQVDYSKIRPVTPKDAAIISEFMNMGFDVTFVSRNLNPWPEVGQEGYSAAFFMNVSWE